MTHRALFLCSVLAALLQGCSTQQMYDGLQAGKRNECQRYPEPDRSRCLATTAKDYESFKRERDEMTPK